MIPAKTVPTRLSVSRWLVDRTALAVLRLATLYALVVPACADNGAKPTEAARSSAIFGGNTTNTDALTSYPEGAVVIVQTITDPVLNKGIQCTGTLIMRDVVLTAAHCLCDNPVSVAVSNTAIPAGIPELTHLSSGLFCGDSGIPRDARRDLGLIFLSRPATVTEVPQVAQVYTSGDFMDRFFNSGGSFFQHPITIIGYGGTESGTDNGTRATGQIQHHSVGFITGCVDIPILDIPIPFTCSDGRYIEVDYNPSGTITEDDAQTAKGDSGGPIFFNFNGVPTIFGVDSRFYESDLIGLDKREWSPTWDDALDNGAFVRQAFANDQDQDGVSDNVDNCNPTTRCPGHPQDCANPDQADGDVDGVGDACDNCPAFACVVREIDSTFCANPAQTDTDGDGVGDVCDVCPDIVGSGTGGDPDGDGVPTGCDNCAATANRPKACTVDADCGAAGRCVIDGGKYGICPDGSTCINACAAGAPCAALGTFGICSSQTDSDGDGIGDACDSCVGQAVSNVNANSNAVAESRETAPPLGDVCDATPVYSTKPIVAFSSSPVDPNEWIAMSAYSGIGNATAGVPHPSFSAAPVGFRYCNCIDTLTNTVLDEAICRSRSCPPDRNAFPAGAAWTPITTGANSPGSATNLAVPTATLNQQLTPTYTGGTDCTDTLPHPRTATQDDLCRIGTPQVLFWFRRQDILAGRIPTTGTSSQATAGIFWSHGLTTTPATFPDVGGRDEVFGGRLRDTYDYLTTPLQRPLSIVPPPLPTISNCATDPQCCLGFRADWSTAALKSTSAFSAIDPFVVTATPACMFSTPTNIFQIRPSTQPTFNITSKLSNAIQNLIRQRGYWLNPVDPAARAIGQLKTTLAVSVPRDWTSQSVISEIVGGADGTIQANSRLPVGDFVPSDRTGTRALFSAVERSVYLIGGRRAGEPTGELWRYSLDSGVWRHLFQTSPITIGDVSALAYNPVSGKLVVIETSVTQPFLSRIDVFDSHTGSSKVAAVLDLRAFSKVGMGQASDGTFSILGTKWNQATWSDYRFKLNATSDVQWMGRMDGTGLVLSDPIVTDQGSSLFVQRGQVLDVINLTTGAHIGSGPPAELSVCTSVPTLTPPPNKVVTSCSSPDIGSPTVVNSCTALAVHSDAPTTFPLGNTVVTWSIVDAFGHTATAQQLVTVKLGDDPSCCPAGSNVIVGTSNNDNLVGTSGSDCILGLGGQDHISGGGGNDYLSGGDGDDVIDGGAGNDHILGGTGQDTLTGGDGDDVIDGGDGDDICFGGNGRDQISGGDGQDKLSGDADDDSLFGEAGDDRLDGGSGNDVLDGGPGHNVCVGGTGTNTLRMCM